jgi:hypothetical protein
VAFTTYAAYRTALMDISITGVTTVYDEPPVQINSASLPIMYPALPTGEVEMITLAGAAGLSTATMDMVIVIEAIRQNRYNVNYALALSLIDASVAAIKAKMRDVGIDRWSMRLEQEFIGETPYWMLIITVEASG